MESQSLKALRIELGLTQDGVAERVIAAGRFRKGFCRVSVVYAERGTGLGSIETLEALAYGLGLKLEELTGYLRGQITLADAVASSVIKPVPEEVARLRGAEERRESRKRPTEQHLPNLQATLEWCKDQFPLEFLVEVARVLGRRKEDLDKARWYEHIKVRYYDWQELHQTEHSEQRPDSSLCHHQLKRQGRG